MFEGQSVPMRVCAASISMPLLTELGRSVGSFPSINIALLTELSRDAIPPKTAKNPGKGRNHLQNSEMDTEPFTPSLPFLA